MRSPDRARWWKFVGALAGATLAQGMGTKLLLQLIQGTLSGGGLAALGMLTGAYILLLTGLIRLLAGSRAAGSGER